MNRYQRLEEMSKVDRMLEESHLFEMSYRKADAMERCAGLGKQFIKHFDKIYNENDEKTMIHHASEMQNWLNCVLEITLKPDGKYIRKDNLIDWFIEAGTNPENYFTGPDIEVELEVYVDFYLLALYYGDVFKALKEVGLLHED